MIKIEINLITLITTILFPFIISLIIERYKTMNACRIIINNISYSIKIVNLRSETLFYGKCEDLLEKREKLLEKIDYNTTQEKHIIDDINKICNYYLNLYELWTDRIKNPNTDVLQYNNKVIESETYIKNRKNLGTWFLFLSILNYRVTYIALIILAILIITLFYQIYFIK